MNCRECGAQVEAGALVCGNCGALIDYAPPPSQSTKNGSDRSTRRPFRISSSTWLILFFSCGLLTLIAASAIGGVVVGLQDRQAADQAKADQFFQEGQANFTAGKLELAKADFLYVLQLNPAYPGARELLAQTQDRLTVKPTPTSVALTNAIDQLYQTGLTAYQAKNWSTAVDVFTQLRAIEPTYQTERVDQMLFDAALTYGLQLLKDDRLEEGIAYLDQAAYLHRLPSEAETQAQYARQYITARDYWNANWDKAIELFQELYAIAPGYRDVFARLVEAHIQYGDERVRAGDACTAQKQYEAALKMRPDPRVQAKLDQAAQTCLAATPAPITGTAQTIAGLYQGRLAYPIVDANGARIEAASANNPAYVAAYGDQPEWQRNGSALAYRVPGAGINVDGRNVAPAGAAWPTFSPDGTRLIYALQGHLYVTKIDGSGSPIDLGAGSAPTWGPKGMLAYSGCDANDICGIMIRNPDKSDPPVRLTGSLNDIPSSWSPDGFNISYYSNVAGDYDLYFVNTAGGVQQVTKGIGNDIAGAWGPDGAHIIFLSDRDGTWSVYLAKYDGTEMTKLAIAPQGSDWTHQRVSWMP
jgi:tetratricopeptide (TPR) repeat protein